MSTTPVNNNCISFNNPYDADVETSSDDERIKNYFIFKSYSKATSASTHVAKRIDLKSRFKGKKFRKKLSKGKSISKQFLKLQIGSLLKDSHVVSKISSNS